jgi:hypothetical protein
MEDYSYLMEKMKQSLRHLYEALQDGNHEAALQLTDELVMLSRQIRAWINSQQE